MATALGGIERGTAAVVVRKHAICAETLLHGSARVSCRVHTAKVRATTCATCSGRCPTGWCAASATASQSRNHLMDVNLADLEAFNGSSYADELGESSYADEQLGETSYADEQLGESSMPIEPFDEQHPHGPELALADVDTGCWGAALNGTSQCCSARFAIGKGHLKKKFCPNCVEHGFFVDARRVRAIDEASHDEFANARGAGLWTTVRTHDQEDYTVQRRQPDAPVPGAAAARLRRRAAALVGVGAVGGGRLRRRRLRPPAPRPRHPRPHEGGRARRPPRRRRC